MTDETRKPPAPKVQVIRRPTGAAAPTPTAKPVVRPATPAGAPVAPVVPRTVVPTKPASAAPRPAPLAAAPVVHHSSTPSVPVTTATLPSRSPAAGGTRPPFRAGPPRGGPRTPPTPEAIAVLARKERVPNRIAKGDLEGKMKCRIWKKLHAEEAKRFEQAWTLVEANAGLELADAFGVVQSGLTIPEFQARRARAKKREDIKVARATVEGATIDAFVDGLVTEGCELAFVLGERTVLDVLKAVAPVSFTLERTTRLEKLNVVVLARKATWDKVGPTVERDPKLAHKPVPVARQPARRPVNDPRPFLPHVGTDVTLQLRNGMTLRAPLLAVGPFDVLVGSQAEPMFVPLHAMMSWQGSAPAAEPDASGPPEATPA